MGKVKVSGIYKITNRTTGKFYVGSSCDVKHRMSKHRSCLRRGVHHSQHLQRAWNKYGEDDFSFLLIEEVDVDSLFLVEQKYLDDLNPAYNVCPNADGKRGYKHSEETKNKISKSLMGHKSGFTGKKHSEETRKKMSEIHTGKKMSMAMKAKMRKRQLGKKQSEEVRRKISNTLKKNATRAIEDQKIVEEIRLKYASSETSQRKLAKEYSVSKIVISNILHRRGGY